MRILVTNDDGVVAPGLLALKNAMRTLMQDGLDKVERRLTTLEELQRVLPATSE